MGINLPKRTHPLWVTLGGHRNPGETPEQTGKREAFEETGVEGITIGPIVWRGKQILDVKGTPVLVNEDFLLAKFPLGATLSAEHLEDNERSVLHSMRWWTVKELREYAEDVRPPGLADLLDSLLQNGISDTPTIIELQHPRVESKQVM